MFASGHPTASHGAGATTTDASATTPTRDHLRPDEPGFELTEEWLAMTPWSSYSHMYGGGGTDLETLEKREITAVRLASSLVSEAARTLPWGSPWAKWLQQCSAHIYRAAEKAEIALQKRNGASIGYLDLPDGYGETLGAAGLLTITEIAEAVEERGGLQWVAGIGAAKEREILERVEEWNNLPDEEISLSAHKLTEAAR
jgi:hypothetical protein